MDDYESIYSVNLLYLRINNTSEYIEEKNGNKYLIFDFVDENKEVLKNQESVWDGIKNNMKAINGGEENDYGKDYMKIKFNYDNDLPLNKALKFHAMTIIIRSVFEKDGKLYPEVFLVTLCMSQCKNASKECMLYHYCFFKDIGFKFEEHVCNRSHDLLTMAYSLENIAILSAKGTTSRCILWGISRNEGLRRLSNSVLKDKSVL